MPPAIGGAHAGVPSPFLKSSGMNMPFSLYWSSRLSSLNSWRPGLICLVGAIAVFLALGCGAWAIGGEITEIRAIAALKQGGHVIYLRHADRARGPKEKLSLYSTAAEFADCSQQRNLTAEGKEHARQLGGYLRTLGISVGRVMANAQCRSRDTALLAFGYAEVDQRLYDLDFLRRQLLETPSDRANTVIVSSDYPLRELTGVDLGFAEAAIVKPDGRGGVTVVARIDLKDFAEAAEPDWW